MLILHCRAVLYIALNGTAGGTLQGHGLSTAKSTRNIYFSNLPEKEGKLVVNLTW
jgi:hypothetical protein